MTRAGRSGAAVLLAAAAAMAAAAGIGAAVVVADDDRRERLRRQARIVALTGRRAGHFVVTRVKGRRATEAERQALEAQFAIRTAEDVARELGNMKGVVMKVGQMISFIAEGLPPEAQAALATLQADVPPMAPSLAEQVIREELGRDPEHLFLDWDPVPVAAASVGQVHRAVLPDGRIVAVKVQYPGIDRAIRADLDNAELLYAMVSAFSFKAIDTRLMVDELRARMGDELDYRIEAANQTEFADLYRGHPFIRVPDVVPGYCGGRVLTSEWVDGLRWADFLATAREPARQRAAEIIFRFAQGSIHHHGVFNGDPHPGNYRFHDDGTVTFLDFGLVKRWEHGEWERLSPCLDALIDEMDPAAVERAMIAAGFLAPDHGLPAEAIFAYVSQPYLPYFTERFTFTRSFVAEALGAMVNITGPSAEVIEKLKLPPSFVILDRVVWGVTALLGKLDATGPWRDILLEYRHGRPPVTELGREHARWAQSRAAG